MASLKAGPYTLEIDTISQDLSHVIEVNCDVIGDDTTGISPLVVTLRTKGSGPLILSGCADAFWGVIRTRFSSLTLASTYTLWKRNIHNEEKLFVSGGTLTAPNGSVPSTIALASQHVMTWRSGAGGVLKLSLLETANMDVKRIPLGSDTGTGIAAIDSFVRSPNSFLLARDHGFAVASMNSSYGQNEKVFDRRYRV